MKNETDARDRKEKRKTILDCQTLLEDLKKEITNAIAKGKDEFSGEADIKERLSLRGSNTREPCDRIKSAFENIRLDKESERISSVLKELKFLIDVKGSTASVERNNCVVLTMPCSSSTEMKRVLKVLDSDQFKAVINKLTKALEETYNGVIEVEAQIDTEAIRLLFGRLREKGIIDDKDEGRFCCKHSDIPGNCYCPDHDVFCCNECAHATHSTCLNVRLCTPNQTPKQYRVRTDERKLCSTLGSCLLPNGEIFLIDNINKRLKKIDILYKVDSFCDLDDQPCDICAIGAGKVLVSFGFYVQYLNVKQKPTPEKKLRLESLCFRLAWCKNHLYYTDNYSLHKCDAVGKNKELLHTFEGGKLTCKKLVVSTDGKKIYIAAGEKGLIVVDIENGNTKISVNREFSDCTDICVVNNDSILVCDFEAQALFLVASHDGTIMKKVADKTNGLHNPWSISFDKADSTLIVGGLGRDFISVLQEQFSYD